MTANRLTQVILCQRWRRNFCLPRYTPHRWWECDVFEATPAGYFREYEIKVTRGDFFGDAKKKQIERYTQDGLFKRVAVEESKHELLAAGDGRGPCQFWFVTPPGLVTASEVPRWAGLIEVNGAHNAEFRPHLCQEVAVVRAPTLHRQTVSDRIMAHARSTCYYRMHGLLDDLSRRSNEPR